MESSTVLTIVKLSCLFIAIWISPINTFRMLKNQAVHPIAFLFQAVGIMGFVVIQFELYK